MISLSSLWLDNKERWNMKHFLPDVFSIFQHRQTYGAFLIHVCLLFLTHLQLQRLSLLAGDRETKCRVKSAQWEYFISFLRVICVPPSCICVERWIFLWLSEQLLCWHFPVCPPAAVAPAEKVHKPLRKQFLIHNNLKTVLSASV